jgi:hypothetical protein
MRVLVGVLLAITALPTAFQPAVAANTQTARHHKISAVGLESLTISNEERAVFMEQPQEQARVGNTGTTRRDSRIRRVMQHLVIHPEFYEPIHRYQSSDDLLVTANSVLPEFWRVIKKDIWYQVLPPVHSLRFQGWKIHISATIMNASSILMTVVPICTYHNVAFKFACDKQMVVLINSKQWDRGSSGKFITIYPRSEEQFKLLDSGENAIFRIVSGFLSHSGYFFGGL